MKSLSQLIEPGMQLTIRRHQSDMFGFSCALRPIPEREHGTILWDESGHGVTVEAALDSFELVSGGVPQAYTSDTFLKVKKVTMDHGQLTALKDLVAYAARNFIMGGEVEILGDMISEMQ